DIENHTETSWKNDTLSINGIMPTIDRVSTISSNVVQ
ncbi:MAG: hypothetical protein ACI8PP_003363, partial [Candidatus Pseudothioglobus sp.]